MKTETQPEGMGFLTVLGLIFITLRLIGAIAWSWWWVLLPLYGPVVITPIVIGVGAIIGLMSK